MLNPTSKRENGECKQDLARSGQSGDFWIPSTQEGPLTRRKIVNISSFMFDCFRNDARSSLSQFGYHWLLRACESLRCRWSCGMGVPHGLVGHMERAFRGIFFPLHSLQGPMLYWKVYKIEHAQQLETHISGIESNAVQTVAFCLCEKVQNNSGGHNVSTTAIVRVAAPGRNSTTSSSTTFQGRTGCPKIKHPFCDNSHLQKVYFIFEHPAVKTTSLTATM